MTAGDLISTDWEMEFRDLLMGGTTDYSILEISGLLDLPDIVSSDQGRLRRHGLRAGDDFLAGRSVVVVMEVYATSDALYQTAIQNLKTALRPGVDEVPLVFQLPAVAGGSKFQVNARVRRVDWPVTLNHYFRKDEITVEFYSTDPRLYATSLSTGSATLPTAGGGLTFDATASFTFGATSTGGELNLLNSGSWQTPVVFRIDGPVQTPRIIHNGLGKELELSLTVASGDYVLLDSESRTVLLNGTASRYSDLTSDSRWFDLEPGNNQISFRGATTAAGSLSATWRSAWV